MESDCFQFSPCWYVTSPSRLESLAHSLRSPAGAGIKDQDRNILTNQHLILAFLRACPPILTRGKSRLPVDPKTGKKAHKHHQAKRRGGEPDHDDEDADADADASAALATAVSTGEAKTLHPPSKQGTVLITLKHKIPYTLWDVHHLATRPPAHPVRVRAGDPISTTGKQPRYRLLRSFPFDPAAWPGYEHRRTLGFKEGVSKVANQELLKKGPEEGLGEAVGQCKTWEFEPRYERR